MTGHYMQNCRFGKKYISDDATIVADPEFEKGVIKMQSSNHQHMTDDEKRNCSHLKVMNNSNSNKCFVEYQESEKINDSFSEYLKQAENPVTTESES